MDVDAAKAHEQLKEIADRQQQAVRTGEARPLWFPVGMGLLVFGFLLGLGWVDNPWIMLGLLAVFLGGMVALTRLLTRRQPVQVHPTQYVRSRWWLTMALTAGGGAAVGAMAMQQVGPGLPGAALVAVGAMLVGAAGQRLSGWARRRSPVASDAGRTEGS